MKKLSFKYRIIKVVICLVYFIGMLIFFNLYKNKYIKLLSYLTLYLYIGYPIIVKSIKNLIKGKILDENFLMFIASIGAFFLSDFSEAIAVLLFYEVGELFQDYAINKTRKNITELMDTPNTICVERNGILEYVDPYEVELGEILVVKSGESVAIDGEVIFGEVYADAKAITGESKPLKICIGDKVLSGVIVLGGAVKIKTTTLFENSTINKICDMVQNLSHNKSQAEKFITKFAKYYTPIVVGLSLITLIISLIVKIPFKESLFRALTFLVISCPCALVISIPITFYGGLSSASKQGILIKGSIYIEKFANINNFAFDKTGTLTKGEFKVLQVIPQENMQEIMHYASICESVSTHPIAKAILNENIKVDCSSYIIKEYAGKGIIAENYKEIIHCGSYNFMVENNITISKNDTIYSKIYIAKNKKYLGEIVIGDQLKQESFSVIKTLNNAGNVYILSGDEKKVVKSVSEKLFVKQMFYELLPHQKVEILQKIAKENVKLCYVGEGINDIVSLVFADVGIAMGQKGADVALEYADIVIANDNLNKIITAKQICKKTIRIVKQNIVLSLAIKFGVMLLSAFGFANMWFAIFADVGVAFLAILNAMRTFIKSK